VIKLEIEELIYLEPECPKCGKKMRFLYADIDGLVIFSCDKCKRSFHYRVVEERLIRVESK